MTDVQAGEGEGTIVFTLSRDKATGRAISVGYQTADAEATAGADYEATSGRVTLPAHESSVSVAVRLLDDALDEPDESFHLRLAPTGGGVTARRSSAVGTIVDDDDATGGGSGEWTVTDLGTPGPRTLYAAELSHARAITSEGRVAGDTRSPASSSYGFVWHEGTVEATFELGGTARSSPSVHDINTHGQVVGSRRGEPNLAFLWENGTMRGLGTPFGDPRYDDEDYGSSWATGINDHGQIVGAASAGGYAPLRAFLWEDGTFTDLGDLGGPNSEAQDITSAGQIVGRSQTVSGEWHAFLWEAGTMTDLGTLGGSSSWAMAINDLGQIVGTSETAFSEWHAFLWEEGRMTDLGTLGGMTSNAYDINNAGQVVGSSETVAGERRAFIREGRMGQLPDLERPPDDGGYSPPSVAYGINDSAQVVGTSRAHAVLWSRGAGPG